MWHRPMARGAQSGSHYIGIGQCCQGFQTVHTVQPQPVTGSDREGFVVQVFRV